MKSFKSIKRLLIKAALRLLKSEVLDEIQYAPIQPMLASSYGILDKAAVIVTDDITPDGPQIAEMFRQEKKALVLSSIDTVQAVVHEELADTKFGPILEDLLADIRGEIVAGRILTGATTAKALPVG